ncbi:hypothetical protein [Tolypothrix sp. VBCCA 56010]|uniref:hypothetical protein n=1 Tax=Tolypothrix sp. VBCCA 56010 TaxID=3137731 RepID=UPI003D7D1859
MNLKKRDRDRLNSCSQGSFLIAAVLGNTGFIGLAIAPFLIDFDFDFEPQINADGRG